MCVLYLCDLHHNINYILYTWGKKDNFVDLFMYMYACFSQINLRDITFEESQLSTNYVLNYQLCTKGKVEGQTAPSGGR